MRNMQAALWRYAAETLAITAAVLASVSTPALAEDASTPVDAEPVVATRPMRFAVGEEVVDQIDKGDMLTVLEDRDTELLVLTFRGKRGLVSKTDVAQLAEAVEIFDELIEQQPEEPQLYTLRASAWWARGDEKRALADYDKAIEAGLETAHAYSSRGLFHASLGNYDEAVADYTTAIKLAPKQASLRTNRAAVYLSRQQFELAVEDYTSAIEFEPDNAVHYQQRALAWKALGESEKALADFTKAIELDGGYLDAWMGRGFLRFRQGEYADAVEDFSQAIELAPELAPAYNNRGYNRQKLGDFKAALADYDEAIRLAPEYGLAHQNKAWLLATCEAGELRNGAEAVQAATTACELSDYKNVGAMKALAAAFAEDSQYDKAVGWQEQVVARVDKEHKSLEQTVLEAYQAKKPFRNPRTP